MDKSALNRATDSTSAPTPGYLYNDIAKSCSTSPQVCIETVQFLTSKLSKNNPHVKKKCLKVLAKACVHPSTRGMLKRAVFQNPTAVTAIKEATQWRGTMDAVTGDQWNVEVREAAKECLEAVYSDAGETGQSQLAGGGMTGLGGGGMGGSAPMAGIGGGGYGGPAGGGYGGPMGGAPGSGVGGGGTKMEGIGNPMYKDPRLSGGTGSSTFTGMAAEVGGAVLNMIKDPLARNIGTAPPQSGIGGYGGPNARPDPYAHPPGRNNLALQTGGQWTMASNRGPNAIGSSTVPPPTYAADHQNSEYYKARNAGGTAFQWAGAGGAGGTNAAATTGGTSTNVGGVGGSWASAPVTTHAPPPVGAPPPPPQGMSVAARSRAEASGVAVSAIPVKSIGGATSNGDFERNLIQELCPPGGMKAEPPEDKLEEFARAVPSLNPDWVCPALLDALEEGNPWIMRAKALCVIETVLKVMAEHFEGGSNPYADFFHACSEEIEPLTNHARIAVKSPARRVLAALGVDNNAADSVAGGQATGAQEPALVQEAPNLLDFDDPVPPAPPATSPPAPPADGTEKVLAGGGGDSLFSGLTTKSTAPPVASGSAPAAKQEDDLLRNFDAAPAPSVASAPATGSNDLFGDMNMKNSPVATAEKPGRTESASSTEPSPTSASAFGFMNASTPSNPSSSNPSAPPAGPPSTQAFDPLLSLGMPSSNSSATAAPNAANINSNTMMNMQAMAYQQNMMMMQQQMQQMQVGYRPSGANFGTVHSGVSPMHPGKPIMGANYMRQVPGVQGDKMSSFSFLGSDPKKEQTTSFDFVKDAMNNERK
eukprot:CAMPEP_0171363788 /NCGR_PEP_ID=MMETSP0879-20121228/3584_1 /TAXON_ID=67004 /ORGANISM="Thalassiosira weissflogii, Strain CCMP1336" /LENGTH=818 /DNA_ID=CAMNT_0011871005 /DNA_START=132 /DNA_END=2588 /DNA_ORIENTATION=+